MHKLFAIPMLVSCSLSLAADTPQAWRFDGDKAGQLPDGWTSAKGIDGPGSEWTVRADDKEAGKKFLSQTSAAGANPQFNLCVTKGGAADVDIAVKVRARAGTIDQGGGIVWRYRDSQNYYICRWNPLEENYRVYKVQGGKRMQMDTAKIQADAKAWHTLRIVHVARAIRCYMNGKLLLEAGDDDFRDGGKIGLWSKADAVSDFDELTARAATAADIEELPTQK